MTSVIVVRRVPAPLIGMCGVMPNQEFEALEERLDWLDALGVPVTRVDPAEAGAMNDVPASVVEILRDDGDAALPLIAVNGVLVSRGVAPTRAHLAGWVGHARREAAEDVALADAAHAAAR